MSSWRHRRIILPPPNRSHSHRFRALAGSRLRLEVQVTLKKTQPWLTDQHSQVKAMSLSQTSRWIIMEEVQQLTTQWMTLKMISILGQYSYQRSTSKQGRSLCAAKWPRLEWIRARAARESSKLSISLDLRIQTRMASCRRRGLVTFVRDIIRAKEKRSLSDTLHPEKDSWLVKSSP